MILFSVSEQIFYDSEFNYLELPSDIIDISESKYLELLDAINSGCIVFSDLTVSPPKPSQFHTWNGTEWVDIRTDAEKSGAYLATVPVLTKRQFNLYMYDNGHTSEIDAIFAANPRAKIEFDSVRDIERTHPTTLSMIAALGWTDEQVDQMWQQALTL